MINAHMPGNVLIIKNAGICNRHVVVLAPWSF
jgi:hypothetical protein